MDVESAASLSVSFWFSLISLLLPKDVTLTALETKDWSHFRVNLQKHFCLQFVSAVHPETKSVPWLNMV